MSPKITDRDLFSPPDPREPPRASDSLGRAPMSRDRRSMCVAWIGGVTVVWYPLMLIVYQVVWAFGVLPTNPSGLPTVGGTDFACSLCGAFPFVFLLTAGLCAAGILPGTRAFPKGHCRRCGYDLTGVDSGCPECGGWRGDVS